MYFAYICQFYLYRCTYTLSCVASIGYQRCNWASYWSKKKSYSILLQLVHIIYYFRLYFWFMFCIYLLQILFRLHQNSVINDSWYRFNFAALCYISYTVRLHCPYFFRMKWLCISPYIHLKNNFQSEFILRRICLILYKHTDVI